MTMNVDLRMTVGELIESYPSIVELFIERRMLCIGCPSREFHTLEEVAHIHGYEPDEFLRTVRNAAAV